MKLFATALVLGAVIVGGGAGYVQGQVGSPAADPSPGLMAEAAPLRRMLAGSIDWRSQGITTRDVRSVTGCMAAHVVHRKKAADVAAFIELFPIVQAGDDVPGGKARAQEISRRTGMTHSDFQALTRAVAAAGTACERELDAGEAAFEVRWG